MSTTKTLTSTGSVSGDRPLPTSRGACSTWDSLTRKKFSVESKPVPAFLSESKQNKSPPVSIYLPSRDLRTETMMFPKLCSAALKMLISSDRKGPSQCSETRPHCDSYFLPPFLTTLDSASAAHAPVLRHIQPEQPSMWSVPLL